MKKSRPTEWSAIHNLKLSSFLCQQNYMLSKFLSFLSKKYSLSSHLWFSCQHGLCTDGLILLQWCHNEHDGVSNHRCLAGLLNCLFRCRSKKTSKLHITVLHKGNSPVTGEFPAQRASNAENVSIWWHHHVTVTLRSWVPFQNSYLYLTTKN